MFLCKITSLHLHELFAVKPLDPDIKYDELNPPPINKPKYYAEDFGLVLIAGTQDGLSYLALVTKEHKNFEKLSSIPEGYIFIFRQEWGLVINEDTIHRVISTLREEAYPPMSDYLDAKVKGDAAQEQAYLDACAAVKEKYPKFSW